MNPINPSANSLQNPVDPTTPVPLKRLKMPNHLDGREGANRQPQKQPLIPADDDLTAIHCWLAEYAESPHTHRAYRREAERLLLWCLIERGKALSSLDREDLRGYENFLAAPSPSERWIGPRRPHKDPRWKPFTAPLTKTSQRQALAALKSLFSYLFAAGYLAGNPMHLVRLAVSAPPLSEQLPVEKYFTQEQWRSIRAAVQDFPDQTAREQAVKARAYYVLELFYLTAGRISELANGCMGDFGQHHGLWWLTLRGKGRRQERIPVGQRLLDSVSAFRQARSLTPMPEPGEMTPLIPALFRHHRLTSNMIYRLIRQLFRRIGMALRDVDSALSIRLMKGTPHWCRHTRLTHMSERGLMMTDVQHFARHRDANTTMRYQHRELRRWHADIVDVDSESDGGRQ